MSNSFLPISSYKFAAVGADSAKFPHFMLVDMNSFFATVEQQANPFFRGRPLGVVASMHKHSSLIAASREAKEIGIKTGTPIWKALKICPDIVLVESEPQKYREVNRRVNRILSDYSDRIERYSIDESFLDFRGSKISPLDAGIKIKRRICEEVGQVLTCSVGIGQNKFLSKLAADLHKPDGLTLIWRDQLPQIYEKLKLTDLWGVARGWERRLARLGLVSPGDVLRYPLPNIVAAFGKPGHYIWHRINGLEEDEIASDDEAPKSFGHSWVLNFRTTDKRRLSPVILRLAEKASRRMRREGFKASGLYLSIATSDGQYLHQSKKLDYQIETGVELYDAVMIMWRDWKLTADASKIAVGFFRLSDRHEQLSLFGHTSKRLTDSLDLINDKYGEFTIRSGLLVHSKSYAPDAIAFGL